MFHVIHEGTVILRERGVFRQTKVYRRNRAIYAGWGAGFIRLCDRDGGTSKPNVTYEDLALPFRPEKDSLGRLQIPEGVELNQ